MASTPGRLRQQRVDSDPVKVDAVMAQVDADMNPVDADMYGSIPI